MNTADNIAHWNQRAALGDKAGTQDLILKQLEEFEIIRALSNFEADVRRLDSILEVGCGTGELARGIASQLYPHADVLAIDSSDEMIRAARPQKTRLHAGVGVARFCVGDVMVPPLGPWDVVYSKRCLINLPSWDAQKQAIDAIADRLVPGGRFLMCEHSQDGLDYINQIRQSWNRPAIQRPWHNIYFKDRDLATITSLKLVECVPFSATYYFLSRILNDKLAEAVGEAPQYNAKINQLALRLPYSCADARLSQGRLWIWEKA